MTTRLLLLAPLLLAFLSIPSGALASQIIPQPWQVLVANADLVGVIECVTAGEIVARYRVVESWKGPRAGTEVTVRGPASIWEPTLPIALCGERYLVAAWTWRPLYRLSSQLGLSSSPGGSLPPWWRDDRSDYFIPSGLNVTTLSEATKTSIYESDSHLLGGYRGDLDAFRYDVRVLLKLPDEAREAAVLRSLIKWHVTDPSAHRYRVGPRPESERVLEARANSPRVDSVVAAVVDFAKRGKPRALHAAMLVLSGGGPRTLAYISRQRDAGGDFSHSMLAVEIRAIRQRLGLDLLEDYKPLAVPSKPPGETLDAMRFSLLQPDVEIRENREEDFRRSVNKRKAFEALTTYDPAFVARYLRDWDNPGHPFLRESGGYGTGSYFAWRCDGDRIGYFRSLLQARDPYIRVAAAIYLCFENETEGVRALQDLSRIPGDPGAWAALNLARRGDKAAARRALEAFRSRPVPTSASQMHRNLQKRLLVLLSNSARLSGVPQPERWSYVEGEDDQLRVYRRVLAWWTTNESKVTLCDPWFEELRQQKIE